MAKVNIKEDMKDKKVEVKEPTPIPVFTTSKLVYSKDTIIGDTTVYEMYEGKVEDIIKLLNEQEDTDNLIYNQDDAIDFIAEKMNMSADRNGTIAEILEAEEDYMRSVGIIKK